MITIKYFALAVSLTIIITQFKHIQCMNITRPTIEINNTNIPLELQFQIGVFLIEKGNFKKTIKNILTYFNINKNLKTLITNCSYNNHLINYIAQKFNKPKRAVALFLKRSTIGQTWLKNNPINYTLDVNLLESIKIGDIDNIFHLLNLNANPNVIIKNIRELISKDPDTQFNILKLLIQCGYNPNSQNDLGNTPLILFTLSDNKKIIKMLLKQNVNINIKNNQSKNALDVINSNDMKNIYKHYLYQNADYINLLRNIITIYFCQY